MLRSDVYADPESDADFYRVRAGVLRRKTDSVDAVLTLNYVSLEVSALMHNARDIDFDESCAIVDLGLRGLLGDAWQFSVLAIYADWANQGVGYSVGGRYRLRQSPFSIGLFHSPYQSEWDQVELGFPSRIDQTINNQAWQWTSQPCQFNVFLPKGWRQPEIARTARPFEPDPASTGVGIGARFSTAFIAASHDPPTWAPISCGALKMFKSSPVSKYARSLVACLGAFGIGVAAQAQTLEEVVVTAEFRPMSAAEVPGSVSVLSPDANGDLVNHLDELLSRAANVNLTSGASRARFIQIRGIGERSQFIEPLNPSVGLLVDGVDLSGLGGAAALFDVQQVEVLRGPQGTLYGANALAGLIKVVTPDVTDDLSGFLQVDAGNYSARGAGGVLSGPINDDLGFRISARTYQDDGFIDNIYLDRDDTNNRDERSLRAKLQGTLVDGSWQLAAGSVDVDNGYDAFSLDNNRNTRSDEPGRDAQETFYFAFNASRGMGDAIVGEVALGWVDSDITYGYDEDWAFEGFDPIGYTSTDLYLRDVETRTADVRLLSAPGFGLGDGKVDWVMGLYALNKEVDFSRDYTFADGVFRSDYEIDRLALYGELAAKVAEDWRISLGLRAEQHESRYDDSADVRFSPEDDLIGGRLLLERSLASGNLIYFSVTRGYKAGGFNTDGSLDADLREFDPETLWNMETGFKGRLMNERLALSAAVFLMQRRDVQIATSITRVRGNGSSEFIGFTGNGAKGVNQGLEVEAVFQASGRLQLSASVGLLDAEFEDYVNGDGENLDGRDQAQAPSYQFFVAADYRLSEALSLNINLEGKDDYYFSDGHAEKSPRYALWNSALRYSVQAWELSLWGRNLGNKDYFVRGFSFPNDPRDGYTNTRWTQLGAPRQFGLTAKASF